ncbi:DUF642 domain-containing protein [bacterium]|nr:DUF642 domain-containing protein [bacterium]
MKTSSILIIAALVACASAEAPNLIRDGDWAEVPPLSTVSPLERHANADYWPQPVIPGWELGGKTIFIEVKHPALRALDISAGSASQTIATLPGSAYRLTFSASINYTERSKSCRMKVTCGDQTFNYTVAPVGSFEASFVAQSTQTKITFAGVGDPGGPRFSRVRCVGFDAAARKLMDQLADSYQALDRGEKSARDLDKALALLAPDFSWTPSQGSPRDRSSYEDLVRQRLDKKFKVHTELLNAKSLPDGSIQVEVERRETQDGDYGKLESSTSSWTQVWVKNASGWQLKSAQQNE